jgi:hypothetical protein
MSLSKAHVLSPGQVYDLGFPKHDRMIMICMVESYENVAFFVSMLYLLHGRSLKFHMMYKFYDMCEPYTLCMPWHICTFAFPLS